MKNIELNEIILSRYATKKFNPTKKIREDDLKKIKFLLQNCASSTNIQPWHFILASSNEAKKKIINSTSTKYPFNDHKIADAALVIVFCAKTDYDENYLSYISDLEEIDGRFADEQQKIDTHNGRKFFADMHKELNDIDTWFQSQVYLNLGSLLLGLAALQIDSVAMEGFDSKILDQEFQLNEKGLRSCCILAIGYKDENDFNAKLPKSRRPQEDIFTIV